MSNEAPVTDEFTKVDDEAVIIERVHFRRSTRVGGPGNEKTASITLALPPDATEDVVRSKMNFAARLVLDQLAMKYTVTPDGRVEEVPTPAATAGNDGSGSPTPTADRAKPRKKKITKLELWQLLESSPGLFFDNRFGKLNPKAPDFKRRGSGEGLWLVDQRGNSTVPEHITVPTSEEMRAAAERAPRVDRRYSGSGQGRNGIGRLSSESADT